jgi:hypothetical protein
MVARGADSCFPISPVGSARFHDFPMHPQAA